VYNNSTSVIVWFIAISGLIGSNIKKTAKVIPTFEKNQFIFGSKSVNNLNMGELAIIKDISLW
jgi:hypothetical protein